MFHVEHFAVHWTPLNRKGQRYALAFLVWRLEFFAVNTAPLPDAHG